MKKGELELVTKELKEYCTEKSILYTESDIFLWAYELIQILYSIGGCPTKRILEKMIPVYMNDIVKG